MTADPRSSDAELTVAPETGTGRLRLDLTRRLAAEALGTGLLVLAVVGSGIMASRLSAGDVGLQLLENAAATAAALIGLILVFGAVSGAHFNPVVTLLDRLLGTTTTRDSGLYIPAQVVGGCLGAILANVLFELPAVELSTTDRSSPALWLSEVVATVTLLLVIQGCVRTGRADVVPFAVGAWIGGAYWFTSSTSFANPAVTVSRTLSDTFAGIAPSSAPAFIVAQLVGLALAFGLVRLFYPDDHRHPTATATPTRSNPMPDPTPTDPGPEAGPDAGTDAGTDHRPEVLFVCVHNAGRSQMAAALLARHGGDGVVVRSAGSAPADDLNPAVVEAMAEVGIDLLAAGARPKKLEDAAVRASDVVITMGCGDACPLYPGKRYEDWQLDDPAGQGVETVRPIRDEIDRRVQELLRSLGVEPPAHPRRPEP